MAKDWRRNMLLAILLLVMALIAIVMDAKAKSDFWTERKASPAPIFLASAAVVDGIVYVMGGDYALGISGLFPSNIAYNPTSDSWKILAPMPTIRNAMGVASVDGKIYAIGGGTLSGFSNKNEVYDPSNDTWMIGSPMPVATVGFAYASVNSTIFVMGGVDSKGVTMAVWAFDTLTNTWSSRSSMPSRLPLSGGANGAAVAINERIYVAPRNAYNVTTSLVYNASSDLWTDSWNGPPFTNNFGSTVSTYFYALTIVGTRIFVIGGIDVNSHERASAYNFQYDTSTDSWTRTKDMPTARCGAIAVTVYGSVYTIGGGCGSCDSATPSGSCVANEEYTISDNQNQSTPDPLLANKALVSGLIILSIAGASVGGLYYLRRRAAGVPAYLR